MEKVRNLKDLSVLFHCKLIKMTGLNLIRNILTLETAALQCLVVRHTKSQSCTIVCTVFTVCDPSSNAKILHALFQDCITCRQHV